MSNSENSQRPKIAANAWNELPEYAALSVSDVCAIANVSRATVYNEIAAGKLTTSKIGTRTLVLVRDLRDYMMARRAPRAA